MQHVPLLYIYPILMHKRELRQRAAEATNQGQMDLWEALRIIEMKRKPATVSHLLPPYGGKFTMFQVYVCSSPFPSSCSLSSYLFSAIFGPLFKIPSSP